LAGKEFMTLAFKSILIPVDGSLNTEIAVQKGIGLATEGETMIHLLHVIRPGKSASGKFEAREAEKNMDQWKIIIQGVNPSIEVKMHLLKSASIQRMIIECTAMLKPDLIILGKQSGRRYWPWFTSVGPDAIARKSGCPVLTVKPGSILRRTKVILIPIHRFFPERKLELGVLLAKKYKAQVHLLAIQDGRPQEKDLSPVFLRAYNQLREKLRVPIEYSSISRHNTVKATVDFAERIMADLILVNPGTESGIRSWVGSRHISDWLTRDSKIQVLDVQPYK
jgi:nucleotide-binding universal stress UspA family protein